MMPELSLNILDVVQNSIAYHATLVQISVTIDSYNNSLTIIIKDNGIGMSKEQLSHVTDPFYTTRTTRNVGLGVPFFKLAATLTGGRFYITSTQNVGTKIIAIFLLSSIDCMPLGDITSTLYSLITTNDTIDFLYTYSNNNKSFSFDTRELRKILDNIPFYATEVSTFIKNYLVEHQQEVDANS